MSRLAPTHPLIAIFAAVLLFAALAGNLQAQDSPPQPADPPRAVQPAMKGIELYSWTEPQNGTWRFRLMSGTNRIKPLSEIVGQGAEILESVDALKDALSRLAIGEQVFWHAQPKCGDAGPLGLPDEGVRKEIIALCEKLEIKLHIHDRVAQAERDRLAAQLIGRWRLRVEAGSEPGTQMLAEYHRMTITKTKWIDTFGSMGDPLERDWNLRKADGNKLVLLLITGDVSEEVGVVLEGDTLRTSASEIETYLPTALYERDRTPLPRSTDPREAVKGTWRPAVDENASEAERQLASIARLTIGDGSAMRTLSGSMSQWSYTIDSDDFGVLTVTCRAEGREPWTEQWVVAGNALTIQHGDTASNYVNVRESKDPREALLGTWVFDLEASLHALPGWDGMGEEQRERRRERYKDESTLEITLGTFTCHACYDFVVHPYKLVRGDDGSLTIVLGDGTQPSDRIAASLSDDGTRLTADVRGLPRVFILR